MEKCGVVGQETAVFCALPPPPISPAWFEVGLSSMLLQCSVDCQSCTSHVCGIEVLALVYVGGSILSALVVVVHLVIWSQ